MVTGSLVIFIGFIEIIDLSKKLKRWCWHMYLLCWMMARSRDRRLSAVSCGPLTCAFRRVTEAIHVSVVR